MPWYLRILDIGFFIAQLLVLFIAIGIVQPQGTLNVIGFCLLYALFLYISMGTAIYLLPARHQKYFLDRSPDNPEGNRDIFTYFKDVYISIRNKFK